MSTNFFFKITKWWKNDFKITKLKIFLSNGGWMVVGIRKEEIWIFMLAALPIAIQIQYHLQAYSNVGLLYSRLYSLRWMFNEWISLCRLQVW